MTKCTRLSCVETPTRRVDVQINGMELKLAWMAFWLAERGLEGTLENAKRAETAWESFWPLIKRQRTYSIRVNGRFVIRDGKLL